jgi:SAM-dependent methyltransferase
MNLDTFRQLLTPAGAAALAEAMTLAPTEVNFLTYFETLRKRHAAELAKAALETAILRVRARDKFSAAERMFFTRESLEQATSEVVARHRATRFAPFGCVADLCCGIGGDALALASVGVHVEAIDSDPLRVAMAEANAMTLGFSTGVRCVAGDALTVPLPEAKAAFADPARRADGRRYLDPEDYTPPLSAIRARFADDFPLGVKIAPGVAWNDLRDTGAEVEFVSLAGELKECVLWFGSLRTTTRRATVLPSAESLTAEVPQEPQTPVPVSTILYDPDAAVTRSGLVHDLAERLDASPIDSTVQLLTSDRHTPTPFATAFAVEHVAPFHIRLLRDFLREQHVGRITVIKRGSPADADDLLRKVKLTGPRHRTVFLTRADEQHVMIVCERLEFPN